METVPVSQAPAISEASAAVVPPVGGATAVPASVVDPPAASAAVPGSSGR